MVVLIVLEKFIFDFFHQKSAYFEPQFWLIKDFTLYLEFSGNFFEVAARILV